MQKSAVGAHTRSDRLGLYGGWSPTQWNELRFASICEERLIPPLEFDRQGSVHIRQPRHEF